MITENVLVDVIGEADIWLSMRRLKGILVAVVASEGVRQYVCLNVVLHLVLTLFAASRLLVFDVNL